jgi:hypothetical protein
MQQQQSNTIAPQKIGQPKKALSQRDSMAKSMAGAYKSAVKSKTLGVGFGGEPKMKSVKPSKKAPSMSKIQKSISRSMGY